MSSQGSLIVATGSSLGAGPGKPQQQQQTPQMVSADYQSKAAREYNNYLKEEVKVSNPVHSKSHQQQP